MSYKKLSRFAVSVCLVRETLTQYKIKSDLRMIEAASKEEAIGKYVLQLADEYPAHHNQTRPLAMEIPEKENNQ